MKNVKNLSEAKMEKDKIDKTVIIFNIPPNFGGSDLRRFFSTFIEIKKFSCFHYKRRPEEKLSGFSRHLFLNDISDKSSNSNCTNPSGQNLALAVLSKAEHVPEFIDYYHKKHWTDRSDEELTSICLAFPIKGKMSSLNLVNLSEFRPPSIAPQGNVGTPTKYFHEAINQCRLSTKSISKLGLDFSKKKRIFSQVAPPKNLTKDKKGRVISESPNLSKKSKIISPESFKEPNQDQKPVNDRLSNNDTKIDDLDYEEEEWDRHRALHNDVSARRVVNNIEDMNDQLGTKDRLFEDKMEVTWDKGSSGLVFYTDAQYWREVENHEEAEDADDWDVDTSEYEVAGKFCSIYYN